MCSACLRSETRCKACDDRIACYSLYFRFRFEAQDSCNVHVNLLTLTSAIFKRYGLLSHIRGFSSLTKSQGASLVWELYFQIGYGLGSKCLEVLPATR